MAEDVFLSSGLTVLLGLLTWSQAEAGGLFVDRRPKLRRLGMFCLVVAIALFANWLTGLG